MSKIAVLLGDFSVGNRPLDFHFNNIFDSSRGLSGTDLSTVMIAKELQNLGHEVHLFTRHAEPNHFPESWEGIKLYDYLERHTIIDDTFIATVSINEPDAFRGVNDKPVRICWQFLNDWSYCQPGFDEHVDLYLSPCQKHLDYITGNYPDISKDKWSVLPLGCDPDWYKNKRVYGRVVWCSSVDRGLHWLLSQWPKIKKEVPEATLKIFYHFEYGNLLAIEPNDPNNHPHVVEMSNRLRYIKNAIEKLKPLGVEQIGSVSRVEIAKQISEASVFAFPCDPVSFTEGFSCSTMEAHAGFTVPVITDADCLGSIYENSGSVLIKSPVRDHLDDFTNAVIKGLTNNQFADESIKKCRQFAYNYSWDKIAKKMEEIVLNNKKS